MSHKALAFSSLLLLILFFHSSCHHTAVLDKAEAEKTLKALDSDVIRWIDGINESEAGRALHALLSNDSAPFPIRFPRKFLSRSGGIYDFQQHTGTWEWDRATGKFIHVPGGDRIIIRYPLPDQAENNATCIIYQYEEVSTTSAHAFPVLFVADLFIKEKKVFSIEHHGEMDHHLPVFMQTNISMGEGFFRMTMENRLDTAHHRGDVHTTITAGTPGKRVLDGTMQAKIKTFSGGSYAVKIFKSEIQLFDCLLIIDIDYDKVSPTSRQYVKDFNRHSRIQLFTLAHREKIADIILKKKNNDKILDFALRFSDLSEDFLSNYILAFKKILDVKTSK